MGGKFTSGERRGAVVLGIVALLVVALAVWRGAVAEMPHPTATPVVKVTACDTVTKRHDRKRSHKTAKKSQKSRRHSQPPATPRSPLDENVDRAR